MTKEQKILWIDDDPYQLHPYVLALQDEGFEIIVVSTVSDGRKVMLANDIGLVIVDVMLPPETNELVNTKGGFESGLVFARWARNNFPHTRIVGFSHSNDPDVIAWFKKHGAAFISKFQAEQTSSVIDQLRGLIERNTDRKPRIFIVHGHDEEAKLQLKNYIQNTLKLGEPIILHEMPSGGRTIIEKFEEHARDIDITFVLLTPDNHAGSPLGPAAIKTARQNVIFELGYFLGKATRRSGKVLLLYKSEVDLPSDISGVVFIDISNGIQAAGEAIRRELINLGWDLA